VRTERVRARSHMRFSHRRSVPRSLFKTLHGLLGAHRPASTCLSVFNLSVSPVCLSPVRLSLFCRSDRLANPIACASFPRLTPHFFL
jgi:hypothetical protein